MNFPTIKEAVLGAHICGLKTIQQAISNWDRSLSHGVYTEINNRIAKMNAEFSIALEVVEGDVACIKEMSLVTANKVFKLGIDFEEEDRKMEEYFQRND
jgi:hypothetical protein